MLERDGRVDRSSRVCCERVVRVEKDMMNRMRP
jgi:hypothetical protein